MPSELELNLHKAAVEASLTGAALRRNDKFAAKLTFEERCAIYGLFKSGAATNVLSLAFGITKPTVGYIIRTESRYYKSVRAKYKELGHNFFLFTYVKEEHIAKVNEAAKSYQAKQTEAQLREAAAQTSEDVGIGHKRADHKAGRHLLWSEMFKTSTAIEVRWVEANEHPDYPHEAGWAVFIDWKGSLSMYADTVNDKALVFTTSKAAYDQYKADMDLTEAVEE